MTALTPAQRRLASSAGAHKSWALTANRTARTQPARDGLRARFEREIVAELGPLRPDELAKRVDSAMRAHMQMCAFRSAQVRQANAAARKENNAA